MFVIPPSTPQVGSDDALLGRARSRRELLAAGGTGLLAARARPA